jgi:Acyl-CoA dehydrogenase, C-terminal domain
VTVEGSQRAPPRGRLGGRRRFSSGDVEPGTKRLHPVAESGDAQLALARSEGGLQAARAFAVDTFGTLWDTACRGDVSNVGHRAWVLLAALNAERAAVAAADAVFPYAGASAVHASQPLQRCFRDLHTAGQHIYVGAEAWKRYAKLQLGIDGPTFRSDRAAPHHTTRTYSVTFGRAGLAATTQTIRRSGSGQYQIRPAAVTSYCH